MSSIPLSPPPSSPASVKRPIESSSSSSASSPSLPSPSTTPRKKQRLQEGPRNSALPTPSPQKNSPFPPSALSSSVFPSTSAHKRVTFDPSLPPLPPHTPTTPNSKFPSSSTSNFLYPPSTSSSPSASLPPALHSLFLLHTSLSVTLSLHLATHPPVLPPRTSFQKLQDPFGYDEEEIVLEKVANFEGASGIREVVENGAGRKFALEDLRRLTWLYEWDGQDLPTSTSRSLSTLTPGPSSSASPSKPSSSSTTLPSLLSLSLAPTRTLSKQTRQPTNTYAFNLAVKHSAHMGGVIGAIGRWSSKQDERTKEVRRRLDRWVELCREEELEFGDEGDLPSAKVVKNLPMKVLQPLPGASAGLGMGGRSAAVSLGNPPASTMRKSLLPGANLNSSLSPGRVLFPGPSTSTGTPPPTTPTKGASSSSLSVTARRQALHDRIAAKASSSSSGGFLSTPAGLGDAFIDASVQKGRAGRKLMDRDELKRRSILSRLGGVAEAVFMLFTAPPSTLITPASPSSSSSAKRRAIPLEEVANVVVKSSKVEISFAEAIQSLHLLISLCPFFLRSLNLNGEEYIEMPASSSATLAPPSPGRQIGAMGGPASPGKVLGRGVGGLREVRERIKRELGE
ncbi:hypothetical protein BDY24DRAFT_413308 [Mrakia frigida]|uniref:DNA replication factor Cdt1 C-terminal domain-containing protein n=1 Tax=Mrakia frigida TaxID=29902 RepID=UPI003FCC219C